MNSLKTWGCLPDHHRGDSSLLCESDRRDSRSPLNRSGHAGSGLGLLGEKVGSLHCRNGLQGWKCMQGDPKLIHLFIGSSMN